MGGAFLGSDVGGREGGTKNWDQGARLKGLGAVYTHALMRGWPGAKAGPVVLLGVVGVGGGRENVGEEGVDVYG